MLNPALLLKLSPFTVLFWFFRNQIPSLLLTAFRWLTSHKKISIGVIIVLIVIAGASINYIYIKHLQSNIEKLEETVDKKNDYIGVLISDIMIQNEAITDMKDTQERLSKEARERLDEELERQETKLEQIENVEELNKWLDTLRY